MRTVFLVMCVCLIPILNAGCTTPTSPGMVPFFEAPAIQAVRSPEMESGTYRRFTVVPTSEEATDSGMHPLVEKQLLYMMRNELEALGYKYVGRPEDSDFFVRLTYSNEHKRADVKTTMTEGSFTDSGSVIGLGFARSQSTSATYGSFCPTFAVYAIDTDTNKEIWSGSALAETPNPEIRLSANHLLHELANPRHFPAAPNASQTLDSREGIFGCDFRILTPNGNDYFPVITGVLIGAPAENARVKVYDIITEIDGSSTRNRPYSEIRAAFDKEPGEEVSLTLSRNGKTLRITVIAGEEAKIRWFDFLAADYVTGRTRVVRTKNMHTQSSGRGREGLLDLLP